MRIRISLLVTALSLLCMLAMRLVVAGVDAGDFLREGENYDRYDSSWGTLPPIIEVATASQGKLVVVRLSRNWIRLPNWVEYNVELPQGTYQLWIRSGGNNTVQAAFISVDGGEEILVVDKREGDPNTPVEQRMTEQMVQTFKLNAGTHTVKVRHAEGPGYSTAFCLDWLRFIPTNETSNGVIEIFSGKVIHMDHGRES